MISYEKKSEWSVCYYADEREVTDGDEGGQHGAEDGGGLCRLLPVADFFEPHYELEMKKKSFFYILDELCFSFGYDFDTFCEFNN